MGLGGGHHGGCSNDREMVKRKDTDVSEDVKQYETHATLKFYPENAPPHPPRGGFPPCTEKEARKKKKPSPQLDTRGSDVWLRGQDYPILISSSCNDWK